eukprot:4877488-Prymnesium_polylepis.1
MSAHRIWVESVGEHLRKSYARDCVPNKTLHLCWAAVIASPMCFDAGIDCRSARSRKPLG